MYAVFQVSGFQYSVEEGDIIKIPLQDAKTGAKIELKDVLLIKKDNEALVGTPYLEKAKIQAEILSQGKDDKVLIYKYKRRTKYRRSQGHRQDFSEIKIKKIVSSSK
jgi:large subunit ribosomal protein L21